MPHTHPPALPPPPQAMDSPHARTQAIIKRVQANFKARPALWRSPTAAVAASPAPPQLAACRQPGLTANTFCAPSPQGATNDAARQIIGEEVARFLREGAGAEVRRSWYIAEGGWAPESATGRPSPHHQLLLGAPLLPPAGGGHQRAGGRDPQPAGRAARRQRQGGAPGRQEEPVQPRRVEPGGRVAQQRMSAWLAGAASNLPPPLLVC